jgi:predicted TIM-barrel fold metal-dependent hydrolase
MGYIDSDAHVIENEHTWDYLTADEQEYRPRVANLDAPATNGLAGEVSKSVPHAKIWLVGDTWSPYFREDGNQRGNANIYDEGTTTLANPAQRAADLDALGIDAQLLISSFWLGAEIDHPIAEIALSRAYNRWIAESLGGYKDRFPWAIRVPMHDVEAAAAEMKFGKENGGSSVLFRGIEHGYHLSDPYFRPIFQVAQDLDLSIVVHLADPIRNLRNIPIGRLFTQPSAYLGNLHLLMAGFHAVIATDLPKRFPRLRWGFVEGGASWVPAVLQQQARLAASGADFLNVQPIGPERLSEANIFVSVETCEDLPYLVKAVGEDNLMLGTDYGHNDIGSELAAHFEISSRTDLSDVAKKKIVDTNGRRFLGISESFKPASGIGDPSMPAISVRGASTKDGHPLLSLTRR